MAGNSSKVVEFFNGSMYMKAVLVEEAPDEGALCCMCRDPLHGLPFYATEPHIFDVHLRCVDYYRNFIHGHGHSHDQEKSSSPAPANHHCKHDDKQFAGFQYPWQPQHMYGNVYHAQPPPYSFHHPYNYGHGQPSNPSVYQSYSYPPPAYYEKPPNPWQPQPNVYGNVYHAQPPPYSSFHHPYNYGHGQPPNPSDYQSYGYPPPAYGSGSINQQAAAGNNNQVWKPSKWGTTAAAMLGSTALAAFLQALFGIALPIWLPFGNT
ncbi:uncharacterized protein LOC141830758 [Curcuma longa]|uniref:uncharacterized protein LOC141830758 n=1 Tax=Curcuma longa TaxID=136217 RepID=UPI003D9E15B8